MQDRHAADSDSEREEMELGEIVKLLEKHDPSYMRCVCDSNDPLPGLGRTIRILEARLWRTLYLLTWQNVISWC